MEESDDFKINGDDDELNNNNNDENNYSLIFDTPYKMWILDNNKNNYNLVW